VLRRSCGPDFDSALHRNPTLTVRKLHSKSNHVALTSRVCQGVGGGEEERRARFASSRMGKELLRFNFFSSTCLVSAKWNSCCRDSLEARKALVTRTYGLFSFLALTPARSSRRHLDAGHVPLAVQSFSHDANGTRPPVDGRFWRQLRRLHRCSSSVDTANILPLGLDNSSCRTDAATNEEIASKRGRL
ncbi:hypothetical protein BaRGS_00029020, partial [Batillaria attramentaria]